MKKLFQEFKEFAVKGNMIDIAIGVIIGTAFNKVIDVLVKQVFLPPLSMLTDGVNWQNKAIVLREAIMDANGAVTQEKVAIGYGALMEALVDFVIIGFTVFLVVKAMNRLKTRAQDVQDPSVSTPADIALLSKMADLLERQNELLERKA
jgi:large conductance mechanosensitive channel